MIALIEVNFNEQDKYQRDNVFSGRESYKKFQNWNKTKSSVALKFLITAINISLNHSYICLSSFRHANLLY